MSNRLLVAAAAAAMVLGAASAGAQEITGAGATFPQPVYVKWAEAAAQATGIRLNYQAIGSGGGINQITNRTVDFGASDAFLSAERLQNANLLQFPTVMGAIVLAVNLPGVPDKELKLTGELVAEMYLGRITRWNDPRIVEMNRGLTLPNLPIAPVYRADASGTTYQFTEYLAQVSGDFRQQVGQGTSVQWRAGTGGRGNAGVAGVIRQTRGAIGYVEYAFAKQNQLTTTQLRNKSGMFVQPLTETFQAAAEGADWTSDPNFQVSLIDQRGEKAWPIVSATFILLPKNPTDVARSRNVMRFFDWAFRNGGAAAEELDYIPMPTNVHEAVRALWASQVRGPNGEVVWTGSGS